MYAIVRGIFPRVPAPAATLLLALVLGTGAAPAAEKREPAGMSRSAKGMLMVRENPQAAWQAIEPDTAVNSGDLVLGVSGAEIVSKNGAVGMRLRVDFDSPLPVLEPGVVLHTASDCDQDFTLDRGRVDVTNMKKEGSARVRLHAWGQTWEATLAAPGASLAVELLGRWRPGSCFKTNPGPEDVPSADMLFLALAGDVDLKYGTTHRTLMAPPGPALIGWNNFTGMDNSRSRLDKLPDWASRPADDADPKWKKRAQIRERLIQSFAAKTPGEVIDDFLASDDPDYRRVGVILTGAFDDLPRLGKELNETKHPDVWDNAVVVLRHWLGRAPGQDQKLYKALTEVRGLTPVQAETVIEFLHGFCDNDLERPETYEMLIDYLADDKLPIRGLAYWHLRRLVPAGAKIPYDPLASKAEREKARQEWKKLVPPGKLPPKPEEKKP
jgi:hypothetical protein